MNGTNYLTLSHLPQIESESYSHLTVQNIHCVSEQNSAYSTVEPHTNPTIPRLVGGYLLKEGSTAMFDRYAESSGGCRVSKCSRELRVKLTPPVATSLESRPGGSREGSATEYVSSAYL